MVGTEIGAGIAIVIDIVFEVGILFEDGIQIEFVLVSEIEDGHFESYEVQSVEE